jgi:hypothetical protein
MLGFEVAGIALGAWPLVVAAFQISVEALENWQHTERNLVSLANQINGEMLLFKDHLRTLLTAIDLSENEIALLLKDTTGQQWTQPDLICQLQSKLGSHYSSYISAVSDIHLYVQKLSNMLSLHKYLPVVQANVCPI